MSRTPGWQAMTFRSESGAHRAVSRASRHNCVRRQTPDTRRRRHHSPAHCTMPVSPPLRQTHYTDRHQHNNAARLLHAHGGVPAKRLFAGSVATAVIAPERRRRCQGVAVQSSTRGLCSHSRCQIRSSGSCDVAYRASIHARSRAQIGEHRTKQGAATHSEPPRNDARLLQRLDERCATAAYVLLSRMNEVRAPRRYLRASSCSSACCTACGFA